MKFLEIDRINFKPVAKIYREGIETGNATFETSVPTFEEWDAKHLLFGRIVAIDNGQLLGWAALSKVSDRCVYGGVAEISIYVSKEVIGKGVGT